MSNSSAMQKRLCKMTVKACSLRAAYTIVSIGRTPDMKAVAGKHVYLLANLYNPAAYEWPWLNCYVNESNETPGILTNPLSLYIIKYTLVYTIQKEEQA